MTCRGIQSDVKRRCTDQSLFLRDRGAGRHRETGHTHWRIAGGVLGDNKAS